MLKRKAEDTKLGGYGMGDMRGVGEEVSIIETK